MKAKAIKGMRDVRTIQGLRNHSLPSTREQTVTEVARLEHEKARLERELSIWLGNQRQTQERLQQVEERLSLLQASLNPPAADAAPLGGRGAEEQGRRGADSATQAWREVALEY